MHAELIAIGSELVLGEIVDTNSAHIARTLRGIGLSVERTTTIADDLPRITALIKEACARTPVVITTGGLGPTVDDPTRAAVAQALNQPLVFHPELWQQIKERFARWGRIPGDNNRQQAFIPEFGTPVENPVGTAPAFWVEHQAPYGLGVVISLPGVPREMEYLLTQRVVPYLRERYGLTGCIKARVLRTIGIGESTIDQQIGELEKLLNPTVGLNAHAGNVDIRITATAASEAEADALIAPIEAQVRAALAEHIYGVDGVTIDQVVGRLLEASHKRIAIAETGTLGQFNARLAVLPMAASMFAGAVPLGVDEDLAVAAERLRASHGAHVGVALRVFQGAGPMDPRGLEYAISDPSGAELQRFGYGGPPASLPIWSTTALFNVLWRRLRATAPEQP